MFHKIRVLLLDDNPTSLCYGWDPIPKISFTDKKHAVGLEEYFELGYLQSLSDIKEYRFFYKKMELSRNGKSEFFLPDAILFDYNFKNQDEDFGESQDAIEKLLNVKIASELKYNTYRKANDINLEDIEVLPWGEVVDRNAFGCFAGAILVYDFNDNACVGLPTTAYEDGGFHGQEEIAYFEDLLKSDFGDAFSTKGRTNPTWFDLIRDMLRLKRERILSMAQEFRISFDLENILNLATGAHVQELKKPEQMQNASKAGFIFTTLFGKRCFHLAALFLDIQDENDRNIEIKNFADRIFQLYGVDLDSFKRIESSYNKIWETFCKTYEMVFEFSNLQLQSYYVIPENETTEEKMNRLSLQQIRDKRISELKQILGIDGEGENADFSETVSVFEEQLEDSEKVKVMLLLIAKLYWNYLDATTNKHLFLFDITNEEIAVLLSPLRSEYIQASCILDYHRAMISKSIRDTRSTLDNALNKTITDIKKVSGSSKGGKQLFEFGWVSPQDKKFVCSFFSEEVNQFVYSASTKALPQRIKNILL